MTTVADSKYKILERHGNRITLDVDSSVLDLLEHYDWENQRYVNPAKKKILLDAIIDAQQSEPYDTVEDLFHN